MKYSKKTVFSAFFALSIIFNLALGLALYKTNAAYFEKKTEAERVYILAGIYSLMEDLIPDAYPITWLASSKIEKANKFVKFENRTRIPDDYLIHVAGKHFLAHIVPGDNSPHKATVYLNEVEAEQDENEGITLFYMPNLEEYGSADFFLKNDADPLKLFQDNETITDLETISSIVKDIWGQIDQIAASME